ncbi:trypsin-like peptidase domain-containing protein [Clostridium sp. D2Q-11]|uniref:Trypsin-like peptidase domain-containing protein n=1 Tax=Anaeromonas frigoriresistens TaxID=2683708 RepID=A0A942Z8N1_9FIRM|nr:serine protease [Anaeromonas frigoriresistens]MBS4538448.1 trypsin-like peptidase domain-containing protein [Anaeromonas frigoriresistens]
MDLSISEQLMYSTVRIECQYKDGGSGTGTGFFFKLLETKENGNHVPVVITNKHVINGAIKGRLLFTKAHENYEPIDREHFNVYFDNFESWWRKHPDPRVDLCAIPIAPFIKEAENKKEKLFYIPLDMSLIPTKEQLEEISALEEILMIGYPNGIWDGVNNKPIFRKGVTATNPNIDYNGKKEFMIDAACFPGSSGSPVFIFNEGSYRDKKGNTYLGKNRILLMGVLYAGPQHTATGEIKIINVPTSQRHIAISSIPNNLGLVIKSERIADLEKLFR